MRLDAQMACVRLEECRLLLVHIGCVLVIIHVNAGVVLTGYIGGYGLRCSILCLGCHPNRQIFALHDIRLFKLLK